jgi:multidrug resistance efflux pump
MGWGRTLLLGDIGNRLDIEDTERDIAHLRRQIAGTFQKDMSQDSKIDALMSENAELKLYLAAIVRLLTAKGTISTEELTAMVEAVDAQDGSIDGKYDGDIV